MATASDLITRAMKALQSLGATEVPTAAEMNDGLTALNALLDSWSNDSLNAYEIREDSFTLTIGTSAYTIGSGGTINVTRPLSIRQAYIQDATKNNYTMRIVQRNEWNLIGNRGSTITSQIPSTLFYDPQYPLGIINVFPTPLSAYTCFIDSLRQQTTLASVSTSVSMPVGYERAMVFNLAVEISSQFGIPIPPVGPGQKNVTEIAAEALAAVKRTNAPEIIARMDDAIVSRSYATYNIYRDSGPNN